MVIASVSKKSVHFIADVLKTDYFKMLAESPTSTLGRLMFENNVPPER